MRCQLCLEPYKDCIFRSRICARQTDPCVCLAAGIYDVVVDTWKGSPTYGWHFGVELSAESWM